LLEKPMANDVAACERILDAARRAGTVFQVAENTQYWPEVVTTKRLLDDGAIGQVVTARASFAIPPMPQFYGGQNPWRLDNALAVGGSRAGRGLAVDRSRAGGAGGGGGGGRRPRPRVGADEGGAARRCPAALPPGGGVVPRRLDKKPAIRARADVPPDRHRWR